MSSKHWQVALLWSADKYAVKFHQTLMSCCFDIQFYNNSNKNYMDSI
jgi:hypothetical protein